MAKKQSSKNAKYNIICLSNQLWDFPNWTNKKHVMSRMAKRGHNVLFIDPPINTGRVLLRQFQRKLWNIKRLFTQTIIDDKSGAVVFTPLNVVPLPNMTVPAHIKKIKKLSQKHFIPARKTILWVYHVQIAGLEKYLKELDYDILVYDCVDNYEAFPQEKAFFATNVYKQDLARQEKMLAERAGVIFASAPGLVDKMKKYNANVFYAPNVGDFKRFKNTKSYKYKISEELANISRPRIGMIGALDSYKFDSELVKKCALENPTFNFVLIGPIALKDKAATLKDIGLDGISNIYYLGPKPYEEKKFYMAGFDVEIIPYQLNDYTVGGCFPVKFHDSLAAGLPVVVTDLPAYAPFADVCYISKNYDEFSANIRNALLEDNDKKIEQRQKVAELNDWDNKIDAMLQAVSIISL